MKEMKEMPIQQHGTIVINQDIKDADNDKLVALLSHKAYNFCTNQDMTETVSLLDASDKLLQLFIETLDRIFIANNEPNIPQFRIYETTEKLFNDQLSYDVNKALSALKRVGFWNGIDPDEKYIRWFTNRVKFASRGLCNKLDYITSQKRLEMV